MSNYIRGRLIIDYLSKYTDILGHFQFLPFARHCGLVGSARTWDGTGCEFDSWQYRIYIPCS